MIRFIQTLPNIVERLVARIASPSVQDVIIRIVSSEEAGVNGVINWLASERLIPRLVALLSPLHTPTTHLIVSDLLKSIITLCAPSPFNPNGGNAMEQGTRDNRLIRELVSDSNISTMIGFMLDDVEVTDRDETDPFVVNPLPSLSSASSSLSHVCNILVELIRRNNSDFSEPHLFHTLRNRLMSIRQENEAEDEERRRMEEAMIELSQKMGIVHLGNLTTMLSERFDRLHRRLLEPRSQALTASASQPKPLTLERFRIVELYAELLHSSNMSILNRVPGTGPTYTSVGILSGGLAGLEALGEAIEGDRVGEGDEQVTQARELPVSSGSCSLAGSEVSDDELDDIEVEAPRPPSEASRHAPTVQPPSASGPLAPGDRLKQIYIQHRVLPTVVDLFLEYPNNDFMHHVVYDLLQQILNGRLGPGINRDLVVDLIKEARLIERILDAQRLNDRQK